MMPLTSSSQQILSAEILQNLFKRQSSIFNRYDSLDSFNITNPGLFSKNMDKYLLHAIEEIYEFRMDKNNEELVDIFNYLLTIGSVLMRLSSSGKSVKSIYFEADVKMSVDAKLHSINSNLIAIRRFLPERKWHTTENSKPLTMSVLREMLQLIEDSIGNLIEICMNQDFSIEELISSSESKIQKIMSKPARKKG